MTDAVSSREITLTRMYDGPREEVFALWTEAEHLARWWGPDGFTAPTVESDPRPGGALLIVMAGPDGFQETMQATYRDVVPPERLVVDSVVAGADGARFIESSHTVTFAEVGGKTEVTVRARASVFRPEGLAALEGMLAGWTQSLQCLDDALTGAADRQMVYSRVYPAPPERVFPLWIAQEHLERWWGPDGFSITVDEFDPRPGGRWVFTMHGPDGSDYPNTIVFEEITPPHRLVFLHGEPGDAIAPFRFVVTFDEMAGSTALSMRQVFESPEARELVGAQFGAVEGAHQTLERLAVLVEQVGAAKGS